MSATPIIDLEQAPPTGRSRWHVLFGAAAVGVFVGTALALLPDSVASLLRFRAYLPGFNGWLLIPALWAGIAVHEMGHLIGGKCVGLGAGAIVIGPMHMVRSGSQWVVRFEWRNWTGGFFKPLLTETDFDARRFLVMVAGGPLASLLLALGCGCVLWQAGDRWNLWGTLCWISAATGVLSLLPYTTGFHRSDGARIWQLLWHPERAKGLAALLNLQTQEANGVRPRDWDQKTIGELTAAEPGSSDYSKCQWMLFYRLLDKDQQSAAMGCLENALADSSKAGRMGQRGLFLEAAWACAELRNDPAKARVWRERAVKRFRGNRDALDSVDASIAKAEGRLGDGVALWEAARARVLRRKIDSGLARFALERWAADAEDCKQRLTTTGPALRLETDALP